MAVAAVSVLLAAAGFWLKISAENPARAGEKVLTEKVSASEAAREILSVLPATAGRVVPVKP